MPCASGPRRRRRSTASRVARDESDAGAAAERARDERQPEAGRAAGDGDAPAGEAGRATCGLCGALPIVAWCVPLTSLPGILQVKVNLKSSRSRWPISSPSPTSPAAAAWPPRRCASTRKGLIASERAGSGHRRYPRAVLRRIAFIVFAQKIGLSLTRLAPSSPNCRGTACPSGPTGPSSRADGRARRRTDRRARAAARRPDRTASAADACRCSSASSPTQATALAAAGPVRASGSATNSRRRGSRRGRAPGLTPRAVSRCPHRSARGDGRRGR